MIDSETGYETGLVCECKPCKRCEGNGELPVMEGDTWSRGEFSGYCNMSHTGDWRTCPDCNGTGKDSDGCEVPAHSTEVQ